MDIYFDDLKDTIEDGKKLKEKLIELTENNEEIFVKNFEKNYRHKVYCQMAKPLKFENNYFQWFLFRSLGFRVFEKSV